MVLDFLVTTVTCFCPVDLCQVENKASLSVNQNRVILSPGTESVIQFGWHSACLEVLKLLSPKQHDARLTAYIQALANNLFVMPPDSCIYFYTSLYNNTKLAVHSFV